MKIITYSIPLVYLLCFFIVSCSSEPILRNNLSSDVLHSTKIRYNQVALERSGLKSAVIELPKGNELTQVDVVDESGRFVTTADLRKLPVFNEWGEGKDRYQADYSHVNIEGRYRLKITTVSGASIETSLFSISKNALFSTVMPDVLNYFNANRHTSVRDKSIPVIDTNELVDVYGGWKDAGGDPGKYLSHLSYSNYFTPQQASFVVWSLFTTHIKANKSLQKLDIEKAWLDEALWGADYLHRVLSKEGFFYATVFDKWGFDSNRYITGYKGLYGEYTPNYQTAFREGGGFGIAALVKAYVVSSQTGVSGEFSAEQYLDDAKRAFEHLKDNNLKYCDDGKENIIDEYTSLVAAVELHKVTSDQAYLSYARLRAKQITSRLTPSGWFRADDQGERPYYHAVEAGLPVLALLLYREIETDLEIRQATLKAATKAMQHQLTLNSEVPNPFNYPRQNFRTFDYENQKYTSGPMSGFFIPHQNETGYWWQGESARLASISAAAYTTAEALEGQTSYDNELVSSLRYLAQNNLDWIMGRNPYGLCMLYGFGDDNPKYSKSGGKMVKGGISNGITGKSDDPEGRGIDWMAGTVNTNWRWVEQWTPHGAWFVYALGLQVKD